MSYHCRTCGPDGESLFHFVLELRQLEVEEIADDGTITYTDETNTLEWLTVEPLPPGYTPDTVQRKIDFFFCSMCKGSFTSDDYMPITPEKLAVAMAGLMDITDELGGDG